MKLSLLFESLLAEQYQTMRASELQEALKKARMKTEVSANKTSTDRSQTDKAAEKSELNNKPKSHATNVNDGTPSSLEKQRREKQIKEKSELRLDSGNITILYKLLLLT